MPVRTFPARFRIGLSFASEQLAIVEPIARELEAILGPDTVFIYPKYQSSLANIEGDIRVQEIYTTKCDLIVVCVSGEYGRKSWTQTEWAAIRGLLMRMRASDSDPTDRIFPIRVGEGDVRGINFNAIVTDVRRLPAKDAATLILERLESIAPPAADAQATPSGRCIYLAQCTDDREDPIQPVNRHRLKALIESLGWTVLPAQDYSAEDYQARLEADLVRCNAFVQLLGRYKWKPVDYDRLQDEAAARHQLPRIVYRSADIDLAQMEPSHREYLSRHDVVVCGFEEFLVDLKDRLERLANALAVPARGAAGADQPLVRVVIRSSDPDALWERVFKWIDEAGDILSHQLAADESLAAKHEVEPCQGFLMLCDAVALDDGPSSLRHDMEECRLLQIREKDIARRPPVALVYWPPPDPKWAKLIRSRPQKLEYEAASQTDDAVPPVIAKFFDEVRRVPRG